MNRDVRARVARRRTLQRSLTLAPQMSVPVLLCIGLGHSVFVVGKALQLCGPQLLPPGAR